MFSFDFSRLLKIKTLNRKSKHWFFHKNFLQISQKFCRKNFPFSKTFIKNNLKKSLDFPILTLKLTSTKAYKPAPFKASTPLKIKSEINSRKVLTSQFKYLN